MKDFLKIIMRLITLFGPTISSLIFVSSIDEGFKLIPVIGQLVGAAIGGVTGYGMMRYTLNKVTNDLEREANLVVEKIDINFIK